MDVETTAMYAGRASDQTDVETAAVMAALTIEPSSIVHTVIAIEDDGTPVAHAALRPFEGELEVKKVFVAKNARGSGVSRAIMTELERVAAERDIHSLVLQTGDLQVPAIALYLSLGYEQIAVYGKYTAIPFALCYRKTL